MSDTPTRKELNRRIDELENEVARLKVIETQARHFESRFREMADHIDEAFWVFDWVQQRVIYVSRAYEKIWGRSIKSLYARYEDWAESIHPEDAGTARESFENIVQTGGGEPREYRIIRPDGEVRWVSDRGFAIRDERGRVVRIVGLAKDITERKQAEEALRISEANYRELFNAEPEAIVIVDGETRKIVDVNRSALELYGYRRGEMIGLDAVRLSAEPERSTRHIRQVVKNIAAERSSGSEERLHRRKDGQIVSVEIASGPYDRGGQKMICAIIRDITARKQVEAALRESEERFAKAFYNSPDAIVLTRAADGAILDVNKGFTRITGYERESTIGRNSRELGLWGDPEDRRRYLDALRQTGDVRQMEFSFRIKSGEIRIGQVSGSLLNIGGEECILGTIRDVTDLKRASEELQAEKERLAVTLQSIGDGVITTDKSGRITLINRVAARLTGWQAADAVGLPLESVFHIVNEFTRRPCENPVQQVIAKGQVVGLANDTVLIGKDGREIVIADSGAPILDAGRRIIGVVLVFRDITESRRLENEILKLEKLESLGMLAGGIAHDFNNFLAGIIGNLSLAKLDARPADPIYPTLEEMEKAALRAKNLTQQLLTFSKGGEPVRNAADLVVLVEEAARFALRGANVGCAFDFTSDALFSDVDEGQVAQVIHNLVLNAVQAMPEGGVISIGGEVVEMSADNALALDAGRYVQLTLRDEGTGIRKEHLKKVFDPYFTTKQKGSGLGLAVAHSVIEKHNGRITVASELGVGTTFTVYLRALEEPKGKIADEVPLTRTGSARVLVMDDEEFIRRLADRMLAKLQCTVTLARDGEEAVSLYRRALESGRKFDAVILDLTVPGGMGGKEAVAALLAIDPQVKAIVSSGYSNDPVLSGYARYGFCQAVGKPYRIQELSAALRAVLPAPHMNPDSL